ncbi:MAG TPA: diguanylate cyclase [Candidatus Dormibacteraeota bacterium]|nr:diguanylate cyclase [Candidatus Dormibacteraeota bacterium]
MLRLVRALGFMAPLAVALTIAVVMGLTTISNGQHRVLLLALVALAAIAGMTSMALAAWSYVGWRLNRIARALEETLEADAPIRLGESGIPAERRLARAFNAASGAFVQVEARATHDRLTGVANRETLLTTLAAEVERAARHHKWLSVAFIDIDRFKPVNDTYGHNAGDAVLRQIASLIADNVRASDLFGRYGGEEFMLILPETTPAEAVVLAEKLRTLVMQQPLVIAGKQQLQLTISSGVAGEIGSQLQVDALVDQADAAMYAAKSLGRNRTYLYRAIDENALVRRSPISNERRAAASAIGQWASDTATEALASVLAPQPHHRGRPSDMIASLATGIALELGLPREEIDRIRIASLLHDLGKLAVPSEILDKPSSLSAGEWQAIGEHPRIGQLILEQASSLREAIPVVLHHHERFNGGGYPHGLRGNEIPLGARIVAVADAYHAMIHNRPYKTARTHAQALSELRENAGTQFDPEVVNIFCTLYAGGVPHDGLEEVSKLHERARGGPERFDPRAAAAALMGAAPAATPPARKTRARRPAATDGTAA